MNKVFEYISVLEKKFEGYNTGIFWLIAYHGLFKIS